MLLFGRSVPVPVLGAVALTLCLLAALLSRPLGGSDAGAAAAAKQARASLHRDRAVDRAALRELPPLQPWSGHAFDACRAPSQAVMDRWRTGSPFTGVGIYLGGIHRACEQRNLTPGWVRAQARNGWRLLPIWVGPQASCTGYQHRITGAPGPAGRYAAARAQARSEARRAAAVAHRLGLREGELVFYDIEPFDTGRLWCRASSLAFLEEWTKELHRRGYRSGVYSHVNSGIALVSRTGPSYTRPDAVWYAWVDQPGTMPTGHVADPRFMAGDRVHQYALDRRVVFAGIPMAIDWNYVSLGAVGSPRWPVGCDQVADRVRPLPVRPGARGAVVRVVQCLASAGERHPTKTSGHYGPATARAVRGFQVRRGLPPTGVVDRSTWTSLLARGTTPFLQKGTEGEPVRRLQRALNAAVGGAGVAVDGSFGRETSRMVRSYRTRVGLPVGDVVTDRVWAALSRGQVEPARTATPTGRTGRRTTR